MQINIAMAKIINSNNIGEVFSEIAHRMEAVLYEEIDLSTLDSDTYYPVLFTLNAKRLSIIEVCNATNSRASWSSATVIDGLGLVFLNLKFQAIGNGWGRYSTVASPVVSSYSYNPSAITDGKPICGNIGQLTNSSNAYVYLRGGTKYECRATNCTRIFEVTEQTTIYNQTIAPISAITSEPIINAAAASIKDPVYNRYGVRRTTADIDFGGDAALHYFTVTNSMSISNPVGEGFMMHCDWDYDTSKFAGQICLGADNSLHTRTRQRGLWSRWMELASVSKVESMIERNMHGATTFAGIYLTPAVASFYGISQIMSPLRVVVSGSVPADALADTSALWYCPNVGFYRSNGSAMVKANDVDVDWDGGLYFCKGKYYSICGGAFAVMMEQGVAPIFATDTTDDGDLDLFNGIMWPLDGPYPENGKGPFKVSDSDAERIRTAERIRIVGSKYVTFDLRAAMRIPRENELRIVCEPISVNGDTQTPLVVLILDGSTYYVALEMGEYASIAANLNLEKE